MRAVVALALALFLTREAAAQDVLRGSSVVTSPAPTYVNWAGAYVGGQASYVIGTSNFSKATAPLIADILRITTLESEQHVSTWPIVPQTNSTHATGYGLFVGYNWQWDEIVFGLEANWTRTSFKNSNAGSIRRLVTLSDQFEYDVNVVAGGNVQVNDIVTLRSRVGYAFDQFMPFFTAGLALGRADYATTATVTQITNYVGTAAPPPTNPCPGPAGCTDTESSSKRNQLAYGFAVGAGFEVSIMPNVFLRADYEFTQFANIKTQLNNARVGVGMRF